MIDFGIKIDATAPVGLHCTHCGNTFAVLPGGRDLGELFGRSAKHAAQECRTLLVATLREAGRETDDGGMRARPAGGA